LHHGFTTEATSQFDLFADVSNLMEFQGGQGKARIKEKMSKRAYSGIPLAI
jgi:hypothetical protein